MVITLKIQLYKEKEIGVVPTIFYALHPTLLILENQLFIVYSILLSIYVSILYWQKLQGDGGDLCSPSPPVLLALHPHCTTTYHHYHDRETKDEQMFILN